MLQDEYPQFLNEKNKVLKIQYWNKNDPNTSQQKYCNYKEKLDKGAYVSVSLFGQASPSAYSEMTKVICDILSEELSIPGNQVYVTYHGVNDWGLNGINF